MFMLLFSYFLSCFSEMEILQLFQKTTASANTLKNSPHNSCLSMCVCLKMFYDDHRKLAKGECHRALFLARLCYVCSCRSSAEFPSDGGRRTEHIPGDSEANIKKTNHSSPAGSYRG